MTSIVVPVYNFAKGVEQTIDRINKFLNKNPDNFEIIFVNDGSTDKTAEVIEKFCNDNIKLINLDSNQGKGVAVKAGIMQSAGNYVIFTDADLPYGLEIINKVKEKLASGYEVVLGSRTLVKSQSIDHYGLKRKILSYIFKKSANLILLDEVSDTQCGVKGFSRQAAKNIFSRIKTVRFAFDVEVIYLAQKLDYQIAQIPVILLSNATSTMNLFKDGLMMFFDLAKLCWRTKIKK